MRRHRKLIASVFAPLSIAAVYLLVLVVDFVFDQDGDGLSVFWLVVPIAVYAWVLYTPAGLLIAWAYRSSPPSALVCLIIGVAVAVEGALAVYGTPSYTLGLTLAGVAGASWSVVYQRLGRAA